jgi:hypothetical protein
MVTLMAPAVAEAVTEKDFEIDTARNLLTLCSAPVEDPLYKEAIHMCYGFLLGAYAFHLAENRGPEGNLLVCLPKPEPSRNEGVAMFVEWLKAHPQFLDEEAVEVQFRFLTEKWPCPKP